MPNGFGGEERFEDAQAGVVIHADAGILHDQNRIATGRDGKVFGPALVKDLFFQADIERAAFGHGVPGIEGKVDQRRFHLRRIDPRGKVGRRLFDPE